MLYPEYKSTEAPRAPFIQKYLPWLVLGTLAVVAATVTTVVRRGLTSTGAAPAAATAPARPHANQWVQEALVAEAPPKPKTPLQPLQPKTASPSPKSSLDWFTPALEAHCREILHTYREAPAWRSRLPLVRAASRVEPLMHAFYEQDHLEDPAMRDPVALDPCLVQKQPVVRAIFANKRSDLGNPLEAAFVKDRDGVYRLDWESFVGVGEMSWAAFQAERPTHPVLLRGTVKTDTYYNYEFADENRYLSYRIYSSDGARSLNAFCVKDSPVARALQLPANLDPQTFLLPVTVKLAYPENPKSDHCVALVEVLAKGWLIPQNH